MAHHKRRKLRKGNRKGCCRMCASRSHNGGCRNLRIPTLAEQRLGQRHAVETSGAMYPLPEEFIRWSDYSPEN